MSLSSCYWGQSCAVEIVQLISHAFDTLGRGGEARLPFTDPVDDALDISATPVQFSLQDDKSSPIHEPIL